MPKLVLFIFANIFQITPWVLGLKYFTKMPLVWRVMFLLSNLSLGKELWIISRFKNIIKYGINSKWNIFRNFQIHFSNPLFEEVMSSSLIDLNWMNLKSNTKGKSFYSLSFKSFKKFQIFTQFNHTIKQLIIQLLI